MTQIAVPGVDADQEMAEKVRDLFGRHFAVVIMDSDFTTFAEVETACMVLFGFTADEAAALSMRVHTTGEAVAAVIAEQPARTAVGALRRRNVLARVEPA